ncbi:MAG TPA: 2-hydroxyacyl-CoA dehydratase, partial [Clostridia bacterium]|nr:2-hydroxyacyl-CoA dehydratase [Clostridia bacterium]
MGADAYIRYGGDPLRRLASRFIGLEDFLHMPPWNNQWFLKEAKHNKLDGIVYLVPESGMQAVEGSYFIAKALEDAGIPVLMLRADPVDARKWNQETMTAAVENFIKERLGG